MPWFMESGDPVPWFGRLYREEPEGFIVDKDGVPVYLRRSLAKMVDTPTLDATVAQTWRQEFSQPVVNPDTIPRPRRGVVERRKYKNLPPAGGYDATVPPESLIEVQEDDVTVMRGTKEGGVNVKVDGASIMSGGTRSVTVKQDGVVVL